MITMGIPFFLPVSDFFTIPVGLAFELSIRYHLVNSFTFKLLILFKLTYILINII